MFLKKNVKKTMACGLIVMTAAASLYGCGGGEKAGSAGAAGGAAAEATTEAAVDYLADMKEFSTPDGTAHIHLNKDWVTEDVGSDTFITAGSTDGSEAVLFMQFPKGGIYGVNSMDTLLTLVEQSYGMTDVVDTTAVEVPGMTSISTYNGKMQADGTTAEVYMVCGETDYAYYSMGYVTDKMTDELKAAFEASCSTFREEAPEVEDNTTVEMTDTVRWFNASYAVLTEINGWDYNRFAGLPANDETKELEIASLDEWWGVTDRASADETLDWILTEGHRTGFAEDMKYLEETGLGDVAAEERVDFILENFDVSEEEAQGYINTYAMYEEFGENAIAGWDYCRAMNLMSFYYLAGYYTEQEALDKSLEIAQTMQPLFESWDDLLASYLRGYEYWAEESSEERQAVYEDLKSRDDNPYAVDYQLALEKTW